VYTILHKNHLADNALAGDGVGVVNGTSKDGVRVVNGTSKDGVRVVKGTSKVGRKIVTIVEIRFLCV
jgi:hypothetical protein